MFKSRREARDYQKWLRRRINGSEYRSPAESPYNLRKHSHARNLTKFARGLIPEVMEDKWLVYFEGRHLFLHDSWTGQPVYRVTLAANNDGALVAEALCVAEVLKDSDPEYEGRLLDFLISNLLLGKSKPFPVPLGAWKPETGVFQHAIAGTSFSHDYPQGKARRKWWRLWR